MTTNRAPILPTLAGCLAVLLLALAPASALAGEEQSTVVSTSSSATSVGTTSTPSVTFPEASTTATSQASPSSTSEATSSSTTVTSTGPEVQTQLPQAASTPEPTGASGHKARGGSKGRASKQPAGAHHKKAPSPSALTPPLPSKLTLAGAGVPDFFISTFSIPPFLLPIYQAAGSAYGIPWQVLAAINEVETDYGRDVNVSTAGAEGWMQFMPPEWQQYALDANGDGFEDPYNPADAIFTAARYLKAAGGQKNIRAAVLAYNHSKTYVESVMLRAELLGGTPPDLLSAITGLSEARFPVHASAHFSDGFPNSTPVDSSEPAKTLVGTVIYADEGAPVIAVQDGQITSVGQSPTLGSYISLRDSYGNTYTYAELGSVASVYPVLVPRPSADTQASSTPAPSSQSGVEGAPDASVEAGSEAASADATGHFQAGPEEVYLHQLHVGVRVLEGTILGHVGSGDGTVEGTGAEPPIQEGTTAAHMLFQIRPAGAGASLIDPKPILDGWVELEDTSIYRAKGESPFQQSSPTAGQVLLESKGQLEQQVLRDKGIHIYSCGRGDIESGQIERRVLATLEFLSVSGLKPTVSALKCGHSEPAVPGALSGYAEGDAVDISAINGTPIAGDGGSAAVLDRTMQKLLSLQGTMKPLQIASPARYPGAHNAVALAASREEIHVAFSPTSTTNARLARTFGSMLTPDQWVRLIDRLGQIPSPVVRSGHSSAAIPDPSRALSEGGGADGNG